MTKKVALSPCLASAFNNNGVVSGFGPSSNVIATALLFFAPCRITGKSMPVPGRKEAARQTMTNPESMIAEIPG